MKKPRPLGGLILEAIGFVSRMVGWGTSHERTRLYNTVSPGNRVSGREESCFFAFAPSGQRILVRHSRHLARQFPMQSHREDISKRMGKNSPAQGQARRMRVSRASRAGVADSWERVKIGFFKKGSAQLLSAERRRTSTCRRVSRTFFATQRTQTVCPRLSTYSGQERCPPT